MSLNGPRKQVKAYKDGRTKQCFRDECDIQKIMARAERAGTISHLEKFQGVYADFSNVDFHQLTNTLTRGREIFDELPAELRQEFGQSPSKFFAYVNDPANKDALRTKLVNATASGKQINPTVAPSADEEAAVAAESEPVASATPTPAPTQEVAGETSLPASQ